MLYDIRTTPEQLQAAAAWVCSTDAGGADVELLADDRMLLVEQGDDRAAWDTGGEPASDEYLDVAPLDPSPAAANRTADMASAVLILWELAGGECEHGRGFAEDCTAEDGCAFNEVRSDLRAAHAATHDDEPDLEGGASCERCGIEPAATCECDEQPSRALDLTREQEAVIDALALRYGSCKVLPLDSDTGAVLAVGWTEDEPGIGTIAGVVAQTQGAWWFVPPSPLAPGICGLRHARSDEVERAHSNEQRRELLTAAGLRP